MFRCNHELAAMKCFFTLGLFAIVLISCDRGESQQPKRKPVDEIFDPQKIRDQDYVKARLDNGLDPNTRNHDLYNTDWLLTYAIRRQSPKTVELLLQRGAKVDARSEALDKTPLFQAAFQGELAIAKLLVANGADVNACDRFGENALREAVAGRREEMVEFLLNAGTNPNHRNKDGKSMRDLANEFGTPAIKASFNKRS
jgi:ankyrin repeat protein